MRFPWSMSPRAHAPTATLPGHRRRRSPDLRPVAAAALAAVAFCLLAGCGAKGPEAPSEEADSKGFYHEGKGLKLPAETMKSLGIQTTAAGPRKVQLTTTVPCAVFAASTNRGGSVRAQASALLPVSSSLPATGAAVLLQPPGGKTNLLPGMVVRVDDAARAALGQVEVVIEFEDGAGQCPPGSFAMARVNAGGKDAAVAVPRAALVRAALGDFVYVADGEYLKRTRVKAGAQEAEWVEVLTGLSAGTAVVTGGAEALWLLELSEVGGMANVK